MAKTLYRKYRPQTFADVVNQQHVRITLQQALTQNRVAHAYIFAGPRGIGKTTMARLLARAVNCRQRGTGSEPCNECPTCQAMTDGRMLDVIEIDAASQTGVDNVRENIIQSARSSPSLGQFKVFIIDEVHMLSLAAFNALLKLLEEPPAHAIFILATTEIHRVPATIISRTQRFDFKRLSLADIASRLRQLTQREKRQLDNQVADRIARVAGGSMRDAESMLGQLFSFEESKITTAIADLVLPRSNAAVVMDITAALVNRQTGDALNKFHTYCDEGGDVPVLVHDLVNTGRALLLAAVDPTLVDHALAEHDPVVVKEMLGLITPASTPHLLVMVEELMNAERQLHRGVMMELPVEIAIIKICGVPDGSPPLGGPVAPASATKANRTASLKTSVTEKSSASLNLVAVQRAWQSIRTQLNGHSPSLRMSLQQAEVASVADEEIHLTVPFELHRQRLNEAKHHQQIVDKFTQTLGQKVRVVIDVGTPAAPPPAASEQKAKTEPGTGDLWQQVVSTFS